MQKLCKNGRLPSCTLGTIRGALAPSVSTWKLLFKDIDNMAAQKAIDGSKALHARRWQTNGTYRLKKHVLPDVRDGRDIHDDAGASASDAIPHSQDLG